MNKQSFYIVSRSAIFGAAAAAAAAMASTVMADGYRNPPPTAEGIGKSGVNSVFVDDASAISYNPANLALQGNNSLVVAATWAKTENSYSNPLNPAGRVDSNDEWVLLPNLYISMPSSFDGVVLGLGITTPYGQGIDWTPTDQYNPFAPISIYQAEISLININPTVAFKMGDKVSVGVGADIYYSELVFNALTGLGIGAPPNGKANAEGDDFGYGGNLGVTWQIDEHHRAIFTYRSEVKLDYEGDLTATPGSSLTSSSFGLGVTYPNTLAAGYGIELTEDIRIEANIEWLEWSSTKVQVADLGANGALPLPQNWDDTFTFGIGGDWKLDENWVIRAGYAFIESPIPDSTISPLLPDSDRHALSLGAGYTSGGHTVDVAYTFSIYDDRGMTASGTYDIDSDLVGVTYSYSF